MTDLKIEIEKKGRSSIVAFSIPSCWDEVPAKLYPYLVAIYLAGDDIATRFDKTVRAFLLLSGNKRSRLKKKLLPEEIYELLKEEDWVFDKVDLQVNKIPWIRITFKRFYGPEEGLQNVRFAEWVMADTYFVDYCRTQEEADLNKLIACLYRPKGSGKLFKPGRSEYRGDVREKFNDSLLTARSKFMSRIPKIYRDAIYIWFASCRQRIIFTYPKVFQPEHNHSNLILSGDGWFGVYDDLRGDPKFGGPSALEEEFIHTIFQSQTRSRIKSDQLKLSNNS